MTTAREWLWGNSPRHALALSAFSCGGLTVLATTHPWPSAWVVVDAAALAAAAVAAVLAFRKLP